MMSAEYLFVRQRMCVYLLLDLRCRRLKKWSSPLLGLFSQEEQLRDGIMIQEECDREKESKLKPCVDKGTEEKSGAKCFFEISINVGLNKENWLMKGSTSCSYYSNCSVSLLPYVSFKELAAPCVFSRESLKCHPSPLLRIS